MDADEGFGLPVLRSADGPLSTSSLEVEIHIEGRVASTELRQTFHSDADRDLEGTYTLRLPAGGLCLRCRRVPAAAVVARAHW